MNNTEIKTLIAKAVCDVRKKKPLVPSITNFVTVNFVANAQLAVGGSAAMIYLPDEGECCAEIGSAMYINLGTLMPVYEELVPRTAKRLFELNKPWSLDAVGLGIGSLRTKLVEQIKECKPTIVRGNASEIIAIAKLWGLSAASDSEGPKGVDTIDTVKDAKNAAVAIARYTGGAVAVSGEEDLVTDGKMIAWSKGGSHFMEKITGAGCSLGGVCAVYAAVANPFIAALTATAIYNFAGKTAESKTNAPASFQTEFLDQLYLATPEQVAENPLRMEEI